MKAIQNERKHNERAAMIIEKNSIPFYVSCHFDSKANNKIDIQFAVKSIRLNYYVEGAYFLIYSTRTIYSNFDRIFFTRN